MTCKYNAVLYIASNNKKRRKNERKTKRHISSVGNRGFHDLCNNLPAMKKEIQAMIEKIIDATPKKQQDLLEQTPRLSRFRHGDEKQTQPALQVRCLL